MLQSGLVQWSKRLWVQWFTKTFLDWSLHQSHQSGIQQKWTNYWMWPSAPRRKGETQQILCFKYKKTFLEISAPYRIDYVKKWDQKILRNGLFFSLLKLKKYWFVNTSLLFPISTFVSQYFFLLRKAPISPNFWSRYIFTLWRTLWFLIYHYLRKVGSICEQKS